MSEEDARAVAEHHQRYMAAKAKEKVDSEVLIVNYNVELAARHIIAHQQRIEEEKKKAVSGREVEKTPLQMWRKVHAQ
jgi:hypothetical protein